MPSKLHPGIVALAALSCVPIYGQSTKAELFGAVRDPEMLPVNGATVDLINTATDTKLSTVSDSTGA
jgi:hypothetical protein